MIRLAALALLLPLAACGAEKEDPDLVLEGTDPVQADGDLTPDATLAPEAELTPDSDIEPEAELEPDDIIE